MTEEEPLDTPEILRDDSCMLQVLWIILVKVDPALGASYGNLWQFPIREERQLTQKLLPFNSYRSTFCRGHCHYLGSREASC